MSSSRNIRSPIPEGFKGMVHANFIGNCHQNLAGLRGENSKMQARACGNRLCPGPMKSYEINKFVTLTADEMLFKITVCNHVWVRDAVTHS